MANYNFGEKDVEKINGEELTVWQSPKYKDSKDKAIEMIDSKKYGLSEGDFWILMNKTKNGKMAYTGLIISHNGCLKINEALENKVNPKCFQIDKEGYNNSLVYTYIDDDVYEVGEYNAKNCSNGYPYAMAFKRCFDRVVLKKSKLAFSEIYSEVEADEFKENIDSNMERINLVDKIMSYEIKGVDLEAIKGAYKVESISKMTNEQLNDCLTKLEKKYGK